MADFIGNMNFFPARVTGANAVEAQGLGTIETAVPAALGGEVLVAIRPEKLALSRTGFGVPVRIVSVSYLGDRQLAQVAVDGISEPVAVAGAADFALKADSLAVLTLLPGAAVVLPSD